MKRRAISSEISARPAGPWLRCFLSAAFWMLVCVAVARTSFAQVDIPGPERLSHVEGYVVNPVGHPAADVGVTLSRDGKVAFQIRTNKDGWFRFDHVKGPFTLQVARTEYAPAARDIIVTDEVVTALERKKLYIILGPGACQDACSSVLTSKRDFDREIRQRNKH
ncbi:MAG: carboxypeptidase-like regulatory domain-containing protein [Terracidiphilus sp.]